MYKRASHYYKEVLGDQQLFNRFYRKAKYVQENFGHDDYRLLFGLEKRSNTKYYTLGALKLGEPEENMIILHSNKHFRSLIESFFQLKEKYVDKMLAGK